MAGKVSEIVSRLKRSANGDNVAGMARFGINTKGTLGVPVPAIRAMAEAIGKDHGTAADLWETGIHEARILAALVAEPGRTTARQMDAWAGDFDSWDVCDQVCSNLFDKTPYAVAKAVSWSGDSREFVKRAGFVIMAALAVHDKKMCDRQFVGFLKIIEREAWDERNFVKKAVNWALRSIGKRNEALNKHAISCARRIRTQGTRAARWIAADAIRELEKKKF